MSILFYSKAAKEFKFGKCVASSANVVGENFPQIVIVRLQQGMGFECIFAPLLERGECIKPGLEDFIQKEYRPKCRVRAEYYTRKVPALCDIEKCLISLVTARETFYF